MKKTFRKPYRIKRKKSIIKNRFFWLGILILIFFGGIFYLICFSPTFQIKEIKIFGNQKVSTEDLQNTIQDQIIRKLIFSSTKSIFLVNLEKLNETILEKFPLIYRINFKRKFPQTLEVKIEERKPVATFIQNEKYFLLDGEGVIFEEVPEIGENLKIKISNLNQDLNLGDGVIEKELLGLILETELRLREDFKIPLTEVLVVSEERINVKTFGGWEIYFNPKSDVDWQLTKLRLVLEEEIPLEKRKDLEYIELRFGNFAYPKYR